MHVTNHLPKPGIRIPLLFLLLSTCGLVSFAQEDSDPVYEITDIPAQRIWYDGGNQALTFVVTAPSLGDNPSITMSISESQVPDGPLSFDEDKDTFSYTPAATDSEPFKVAFLAVGDGTPLVVEVNIEPVQPLPAEVESFGLEPGAKLPDDEANDKYFKYTESIATPAGEPAGSTRVWFNQVDRPETRAITISGRTIILEKDHPNQLFEKLNYDAVESPNQDIERLEIFADRIIIRDSIHLPQTNVTLHALELIFEDQGESITTLSTTPLVPDGGVRPPPAGESGFLSEADQGSPGGSITLYLNELQATGSAKRFILDGGQGRAASPGKDGLGPTNSSTKIIAYATDYYPVKNLLAAKITTPVAVYAKSKSNYDARSAWGTQLPSEFRGRNATAAGRPGKGGDGGHFVSNLDLADFVQTNAGPAGSKGSNTTGGIGTKITGTDGKLYSSGVIYSGSRNVLSGKVTANSGYPYSVYAVNGANATAPSASGTGAAGSATISSETPPLWLSSKAMRYSLTVLRDAYLDGHVDFLTEQLDRYLSAIEEAEASDLWAGIDPDEIEAIEEIRDEMLTLKARIDNNLDFFSNPAGWVPMLSFEVNYAAFEQEIDRALRVMYLNYWLGNIASDIADRVKAMKEMREQLLEQIDQDRDAYSNAVDEIPGVRVQAEELQDEIDRVLEKIQAVEKEVLKKAKRVVAAKKAARTLGKIAQMIPVYQPALGAAGGAVAAAADIDPNKSWEENAINVGTGAANGFAAGKALPKGNAAKGAMAGIDTSDGDLADDPEVRAALKESRGPLLELAQDVGGLMLADKASDPEVQAELQRLLADHPEYRSLKKDLDKLNVQKRDFAGQIAELLQKITVLPIQVARNLRAISQLNQVIGSESAKLDPTTLSFLDDMNARAQERLLKYHYYLSRAYAYRRLDSYKNTLNMDDIFTKIVELAGSNGADISPEQFDNLKAVYESQISDVAEAILNEANENPSEQSISVLFELPQNVVDQINAGEVARLNLGDLDLFPDSEENLRITGLEVTDMDLTPDPETPSPNAYSLVFKHSGVSRLQKDGHTYLFRHYSERTRSAITWKSVYQFLSGLIEPTEPSAASTSLIGTLVNKDPNDILIYTRPAVNSDLFVSSEINTDGAVVHLNSATVRLRYDYTAKSEFIKSIKVTPGENGLMPEITVLTPDENDRTNGRDEFERFYKGINEATIEAPLEKDGLRFVRWEGTTLANPNANTQTLALDKSYKLTPIYEIAETYELTVEAGTGSGTYELGAEVPIVANDQPGLSFLRWDGASVTHSGLASTTIPIYGDTTVTALFESSTKSAISISPTENAGFMQIHIESDYEDWILQVSEDLETWEDFQTLKVTGGSIDTTVEIGTDALFFQVIPTGL